MKKITTETIRRKKNSDEPITMLTAYDYPTAMILDEAGIDILLVGDSVGMVVLGYEDTTQVTMEDMLHHVKAVTRGSKRSLIVADLPFLSYHLGVHEAVKNAGRLIQEGKANAVKLEGGIEVVDQTKAMVNAGIPVMGHLGLTPQSINQLGGYYIQGKSEEKAKKLIEDAKALEEAGVFAIVLECIPTELAELITKNVNVPTIGIGAGANCDGQVLVTHDILNLYSNKSPKFVKEYANIQEIITEATKNYIEDVKSKTFPSSEHVFHIDESVMNLIIYGGNN
ncbi:MAG: 3-methyl-2-oxobutanoate hydroxymethyltransferase [Vallitalea sp.]|jgi:3-methyl-2-oxobutanoate hydroxymethyltransferase|nr:3-methyl-2-oxobutanoate hydroxymethyltransferase [Vallitalea sp.]